MNFKIIRHVIELSIGALVIAAGMLIVTSCSDSSNQADLWQRIESAIGKTMSENGIPGAIVGVWSPTYGDRIIVRGKADIETGRAMDRVDRIRIASITKTFTVTVILQLIDEKKYLELDQHIDTWFTESEIPGSNEITVEQLCNMTSGLFNYSDDETFLKVYTEDPNKVWKPEELVALAVAHDPYFPPGTGWHYSNTNTVILGMIIAQITGKEVGEEINDRIIDRLNLEDTYYPEGTGIDGVHSRGYVAGETEGELVDVTEKLNPSGMGASGALISNVADLKTWITACATGDLLSELTQEQRTTFVAGDYDYGGKKIQYGLGIMSAYGFLGHPGDAIGYTNAAFHSLQNGTTIVVLLNKAPNHQPAAGLSLFMDIAQIMFPLPSSGQ
jgi:D-alanyl-D-alanine carboxypeptidase